MSRHRVGRGASSPLGATVSPGGIDFSVYSKDATLLELLLFDRKDAGEPAPIISLDPRQHRT
jgi:isoamylase